MRAAVTEAMLDAAERAMIARGYERATMQEIAAAAGCAAGTFYLYFRNKAELFQAIVARHARVLFSQARQALESDGDPLERIQRGVAAHLRYIHEHRPFFRLFFAAMPMRHRALHRELRGSTRKEHDQYNRRERQLLVAAQKAGQLRNDFPAAAIQEFMSYVGMGMVEEFVFSDDPPKLREQMRRLWGLMAGGIGAKGNHAKA